MKDVDAALFLAKRGRARADIQDHRILGFGQISHGEEAVRLEIGDDKALAGGESFLCLGDHVAVLRYDRLDELEGMADKVPCLIGLLQHEPRAFKALIGNGLLGVGQRQGL